MGATARDSLNSVKAHLRLDELAEGQILRELSHHLEEEVQELKEAGLSESEAAETATKRFGPPQAIAQEMYQAHSQGTWLEASLAAAPHLLIALMFSLHLWRNGNWILAASVAMTSVALYGWRRGKPTWFYPWLGYSLIPMVIAGLLSILVIGQTLGFLLWGKGPPPSLWAWLAVLAYLPLGLWIMGSVSLKVVRRDWIYASLMALPLPILGGWLWSLFREGRVLGSEREKFQNADVGLALAFLALALTVAAFVRLRWRSLKFSVLLIAALIIPLILLLGTSGGINPLGLLLTALFLLGFLLVPAFLELTIGNRDQDTGTESESWFGQARRAG